MRIVNHGIIGPPENGIRFVCDRCYCEFEAPYTECEGPLYETDAKRSNNGFLFLKDIPTVLGCSYYHPCPDCGKECSRYFTSEEWEKFITRRDYRSSVLWPSETIIAENVDDSDLFECYACHSDLKENTKYCPNCGRRNVEYETDQTIL